MKETFVWARIASPSYPLGTWTALPPDKEKFRAVLRSVETGKVLCPIHCCWENYVPEGDFALTCQGGKKIDCFLVPWFVRKDSRPLPKNRGVLLLTKEGRAWCEEYESRKEEPPFPQGIHEEHDGRFPDWYPYTQKKLLLDSEGIPADNFLFSLTADYDSASASLLIRSLDREKILSIPEGNLMHVCLKELREINHFYIGGKKIPGKKSARICYATCGCGKLPSVPAFLSAQAEKVAERLVSSYAGRPIRVNKNYFHGLDLLRALSFFPYEANVFEVSKKIKAISENPDEEAWVSPRDSDVYNKLCQKLGIKSFPMLRKMFEQRPDVLVWYKNLHDMGFRDLNIITDILRECEQGFVGDNTFVVHIDSYNPSVYEAQVLPAFIFFCGYSIPLRGERATWKALNRQPGLNVWDRADIARQFSRYFTELKAEEREMVLKQGFTSRVHDTLTTIVHSLKYKNHVFNYQPAQLSLEDEIDGYRFLLPPDSETMHLLGSAMHNCVFSYWESVLSGSCTIVYAIKDEKYTACIEVRNLERIIQARSDYNGSLKGDIRAAVKTWCKKHRLDSHLAYGL